MANPEVYDTQGLILLDRFEGSNEDFVIYFFFRLLEAACLHQKVSVYSLNLIVNNLHNYLNTKMITLSEAEY